MDPESSMDDSLCDYVQDLVCFGDLEGSFSHSQEFLRVPTLAFNEEQGTREHASSSDHENTEHAESSVADMYAPDCLLAVQAHCEEDFSKCLRFFLCASEECSDLDVHPDCLEVRFGSTDSFHQEIIDKMFCTRPVLMPTRYMLRHMVTRSSAVPALCGGSPCEDGGYLSPGLLENTSNSGGNESTGGYEVGSSSCCEGDSECGSDNMNQPALLQVGTTRAGTSVANAFLPSAGMRAAPEVKYKYRDRKRKAGRRSKKRAYRKRVVYVDRVKRILDEAMLDRFTNPDAWLRTQPRKIGPPKRSYVNEQFQSVCDQSGLGLDEIKDYFHNNARRGKKMARDAALHRDRLA
jgi:hypothetical protein